MDRGGRDLIEILFGGTQDIQCPGWDLNQAHLSSEVLLLEPRCSVYLCLDSIFPVYSN